MDEEALKVKLETSVGLSNDVLSNEEEALAQILLHKSTNKISSINTEILRVRSILEGLEKQCADESAWRMRLSIGLSFHKKLPHEVLGHIFKLYVNYPYRKLDMPPNRQSPCMVLSQVCSRWRQVALGEPSLWNMISIEVPRRVRPDVLETIFSRAGNNITFQSAMEQIPPPLLRVTHQYSNHFTTLELQFTLSQACDHISAPFEGLARLRHLLLKVRQASFGRPEWRWRHFVLSLFKSAFELQRLQIQPSSLNLGIPLDLGLSQSSTFFWPDLRHIDIGCDISTLEFLYILVGCSQLESCTVKLDHTDNHDAFLVERQLDKILMANLRSLRLYADGTNIGWLLYNLVAPSLNELRISYSHTEPHAVLHFIRRTELNIRILDITSFPGRPSDLEALMRAIPKTIELFLAGCTVNSSVLHSLNTRELLPEVNILGLEGHFDSLQAVQELISKRCNPGLEASAGVIKDFFLRLSEAGMTEEWEKFAASLPENSAVRFGTPYMEYE